MKDAAELCRGLLRKAASDRRAMDPSIAAQALDSACFHAQEIAEKCLKAYLAYRGASFPYTHNLAKLVEVGARFDPTFNALLPTALPLTPFAVELRYDDSFWPDLPTAQEARTSALTVLRYILDRLPPEMEPASE